MYIIQFFNICNYIYILQYYISYHDILQYVNTIHIYIYIYLCRLVVELFIVRIIVLNP